MCSVVKHILQKWQEINVALFVFIIIRVRKAHRSHRKLMWFWYTCLKGCVASYCLVISAGLPTSDSDLEWDPLGVGLGNVFICRPATTTQILSELVWEVITQWTWTSQNQVACDRSVRALNQVYNINTITLQICVTFLCHMSADSFSLFNSEVITFSILPEEAIYVVKYISVHIHFLSLH